MHDPHLESRNAKLDFIRASNWLGGGECDDAYYETIDVEKTYKDWTEGLKVASPHEAKQFLLKKLANPSCNNNAFWTDHIGSLVRSIGEGDKLPACQSYYTSEIRDAFCSNFFELTRFTAEHIAQLRTKK